MMFRIEDVRDWEMLPDDTEMVDVGQVVKREEGRMKNAVRVHKMIIDAEGSVSYSSGGTKREL
jgi:hypothetical protein